MDVTSDAPYKGANIKNKNNKTIATTPYHETRIVYTPTHAFQL
jgi:hypothetical protein